MEKDNEGEELTPQHVARPSRYRCAAHAVTREYILTRMYLRRRWITASLPWRVSLAAQQVFALFAAAVCRPAAAPHQLSARPALHWQT